MLQAFVNYQQLWENEKLVHMWRMTPEEQTMLRFIMSKEHEHDRGQVKMDVYDTWQNLQRDHIQFGAFTGETRDGSEPFAFELFSVVKYPGMLEVKLQDTIRERVAEWTMSDQSDIITFVSPTIQADIRVLSLYGNQISVSSARSGRASNVMFAHKSTKLRPATVYRMLKVTVEQSWIEKEVVEEVERLKEELVRLQHDGDVTGAFVCLGELDDAEQRTYSKRTTIHMLALVKEHKRMRKSDHKKAWLQHKYVNADYKDYVIIPVNAIQSRFAMHIFTGEISYYPAYMSDLHMREAPAFTCCCIPFKFH
jgi:DNA-binding PadR family transcriptional regulator